MCYKNYTKKTFFILLALCTFYPLLRSFQLPLHDAVQDDEPPPLNNEPKDIKPPKKQIQKKRILPKEAPMPQTLQEQKEQSIIQTMDELSLIAEGLAKFAQSKEAQEIIKAKAQERERKEKEAEQRRRSGGGGKSSWRPSSSSYTPPRQRPGSSNYWSPSSQSSSSWNSGRSSPWTTTPSGSTPGSFGRNQLTPIDIDTEDEEEDKKTLEPSKRESSKTSKNDKPRSGVIKEEPRKESETSYTRAINYTKKAADELKASLESAEKKPSSEEIAKEFLTRNSFSELQKLLDKADDAKNELRDDELKSLESKRNNALKKEQNRLDVLYKKLFPHALVAATFTEASFNEDEQKAAQKILFSTAMQKHLNESIINTHGDKLLTTWLQKIDADVYKKNKENFDHIKAGRPAPHPAAGNIKNTKDDLVTYFTARKGELEKIQTKLPTSPAKISEKIKEIESLVK